MGVQSKSKCVKKSWAMVGASMVLTQVMNSAILLNRSTSTQTTLWCCEVIRNPLTKSMEIDSKGREAIGRGAKKHTF